MEQTELVRIEQKVDLATYTFIFEPELEVDRNRLKQGSHLIHLLSDVHLVSLDDVESRACR